MENPQNVLALALIAVGACVFLCRHLVLKAKPFISSPKVIKVAGIIRLILGIVVLWFTLSFETLYTWILVIGFIGCLLVLSGILMTFFVNLSRNLINDHIEKIVPVVSLSICLIGVLLL
ncbi:MAG: hypothetical protein ACO397_04210 [Gammaproteobacteria bacterium]|jgi:hypothetical protein